MRKAGLFLIVCTLLYCHLPPDVNQEMQKEAIRLYNQACKLERQKNYQMAIELLTQAVKLDPTFHEAYHKRGTIYKLQKKYKLALSDYTMSIKLEPSEPVYYNNRARLLQEMGKSKEAEENYNKAVEIMTRFPSLAKPQIYFNRAMFYYDNQKYDEAISDLQKVLTFNPDPLTKQDILALIEEIEQKKEASSR